MLVIWMYFTIRTADNSSTANLHFSLSSIVCCDLYSISIFLEHVYWKIFSFPSLVCNLKKKNPKLNQTSNKPRCSSCHIFSSVLSLYKVSLPYESCFPVVMRPQMSLVFHSDTTAYHHLQLILKNIFLMYSFWHSVSNKCKSLPYRQKAISKYNSFLQLLEAYK